MEKNHVPDFQLKSLPWKRILIAAGALAAVLVLLLLITVWYLIATAPDLSSIDVSPSGSATYICDQNGNYVRKLTLASSNRDIVSLSEIPEALQHAVIAIEDERFFEHSGIDIRGIARAFLSGIAHGSFTEGASTITQQLIKNSIFTEWTQENSFHDRFSRKIQEQYLAVQLEKTASKDEILEDYLNTINFGAGCYGVQAASRRYFGKDVSELTLSESAVLAAIPQNPSSNNPISHPEANRKRREIVLNYMEEQGYITESQKNKALSDDVYGRIHAYDETYENETAYSWYEDALIDQVIDTLMSEMNCSSDQAYRAVYSGGLRIYSAQDCKLQQICNEEFQNPANFPEGTQYGADYALSVADENGLVTHYSSESLRSWIRETENEDFDLICSSEEEAQGYADAFRNHIIEIYTNKQGDSDPGSISILGERLTLSPQPQASLVLIEQETGFVRALVGGRGEKTASLTLNRASETLRQPGSTFKILTAYAPALDAHRQTLATVYENEPFAYSDGTPVSNWDVTDYSGDITIREAITRSVNVVAVKCLTKITPRSGFDYARRLGITTLVDYSDTDGQASDVIQPLALGGITRGVSNLELCGAYAAIANGGLYTQPKLFTKILDRHGNTVIDCTSRSNSFVRVLKESTAFLLTDAMRDVVTSPGGTAYGTVYASGQPVAGKTGTTSSYRDIWFVGYTPLYTCSVWGGYDNNGELPDGSNYHSYSKTLWTAVMDRIHAGLPAGEFTQPDSVVSVTLCRKSHLIAVPGGCPETYTEYFEDGTQPDKICDIHEPVPETEPITIYQELLDQILTEPETGSEAESESNSELVTDTESESDSESAADTESESGSEPDTGIESEFSPESDINTESGSGPTLNNPGNISDDQLSSREQKNQPETSSFEDLINRLNGQNPGMTTSLF